jgi:methanogenic corrinoid protein MtbC1
MSESILVAAMLRLDEERVLKIVGHMLDKGTLALDILDEVREGIFRVRQMYEQGNFFLADLMMSAEIFTSVATILIRNAGIAEGITVPPVVVGTVKNDIHDIGKNITVQLLKYKGFPVIDLGVDVPPLDFIRAIRGNCSKLLFMSGLLTQSYEPMKLTVQELQRNGLRDDVTVVIGGLVNEQVRRFVGADYWTRDSWVGLDLCQSILFPWVKDIIEVEGEQNNERHSDSVSYHCGGSTAGSKRNRMPISSIVDRIGSSHRPGFLKKTPPGRT